MKLKNVKVGQTVQLKKYDEYKSVSSIYDFVKAGVEGKIVEVNMVGSPTENVRVVWNKARYNKVWWCNHKEIKLIKDVEE